MATDLDLELKKLLVGTNDLRRRTGQAFYHFYRTLVFWADKDLSFLDSTKVWMAAGAQIFNLTASSLESIGTPSRDEPLRTFSTEVLRQLADDLERGEHTRIAHVRWLEARFPALTKMMRREASETPIYDSRLARGLAQTFTLCAGATRGDMVAYLREAADELLRRDG